MADVPPGAQERLTIERDVRVVQRRRAFAEEAAKLEALLGAGVVGSGEWGWRQRARAAGHTAEVDALEAAENRVKSALTEARKDAVAAYRLRLYRDGQERLRSDPALRLTMLTAHAWAARSEEAAVAFGLERRDRTLEL